MENVGPREWVEQFRTLLNPPVTSEGISYEEPFIENQLTDSDFTFQELQSVLHIVKNNKAPGEDGVHFEFFKNALHSLLCTLLNVYNVISKEGNVPRSFKKSIIFLLHEKGDFICVQNYRGL